MASGVTGVHDSMFLDVLVVRLCADSMMSTLTERFIRAPVPPECILKILYQVSLGMEFLHNRDPPLLHRCVTTRRRRVWILSARCCNTSCCASGGEVSGVVFLPQTFQLGCKWHICWGAGTLPRSCSSPSVVGLSRRDVVKGWMVLLVWV